MKLTKTWIRMTLWGLVAGILVVTVAVFMTTCQEGLTTMDRRAVIPKNIFQTWKTKTLPPKMQACVDRLKESNPDFNHYLYDDDDCLTFLEEHFDQDVVEAYQSLIPGAYKADLWRYCVLYIHGGIYLDIKYQCVGDFCLNALVYEEHFCKDIKYNHVVQGVYNACMICRPGNLILKQCIAQVVTNVRDRFYGSTVWDVTGPTMMTRFLDEEEMEKLDELVHVYNPQDGQYYIVYKGRKILMIYPEYRQELEAYRKMETVTPYYEAWSKRQGVFL